MKCKERRFSSECLSGRQTSPVCTICVHHGDEEFYLFQSLRYSWCLEHYLPYSNCSAELLDYWIMNEYTNKFKSLIRKLSYLQVFSVANRGKRKLGGWTDFSGLQRKTWVHLPAALLVSLFLIKGSGSLLNTC